MKRQKSFQNDQATLFLVATPIGNLQEMTPRAIETLRQVEVIAAEDTRNTLKLLKHFEIKTKLIAHHRFNEYDSAKGIIKLLNEGKNVALVSDAGFPLVCDPGSILTQEVIKAGYNVVVVNGSSALLSALVASGLTISPFYFHGFLPHGDSDARKVLSDLENYPMTLVFYESVHRLQRTLELLLEVFGNRNICLAKELTKLFEEYFRGTVKEVLAEIADIKGEFVIIVEGKADSLPDIAIGDLLEKVENYITSGMSVSEAVKIVAKEANISKNKLYRHIHLS